ncbi:MAG: hydrogenase maturation protease [Coriobacteriaceae bacterium]|nr:hydrogenase maturation protease [Coriobacteriaceae bacterium]
MGDTAARHSNPEGAAVRIAVFCVGNRLMLDEGLAPAAYDELQAAYDFPDTVRLFDVGCMTLDMLPYVRDFDHLITLDAVDGTGAEPGSVFRFLPADMARHEGARSSLHDLRLADLFDAALLVGYEASGMCFGMQVENMSPPDLEIGLTHKVRAALPRLIDTVLAELVHRGATVTVKETGERVGPAWTHASWSCTTAAGRVPTPWAGATSTGDSAGTGATGPAGGAATGTFPAL